MLMMKFVKGDLETSLEGMWYYECGQGVDLFANISIFSGRMADTKAQFCFSSTRTFSTLCREK